MFRFIRGCFHSGKLPGQDAPVAVQHCGYVAALCACQGHADTGWCCQISLSQPVWKVLLIHACNAITVERTGRASFFIIIIFFFFLRICPQSRSQAGHFIQFCNKCLKPSVCIAVVISLGASRAQAFIDFTKVNSFVLDNFLSSPYL